MTVKLSIAIMTILICITLDSGKKPDICKVHDYVIFTKMCNSIENNIGVYILKQLIVHQNYLLVYDVTSDAVRILRVLHSARMWPPSRK